MNWIELTDENQIDEIKEFSKTGVAIVYKHSHRCATCTMALARIERSWNNDEMLHTKPFFVNVVHARSLSNKIADFFEVRHESPQILIIKDEKCIYTASHLSISYPEVKRVAA
ncbi:MAG TPA: bacillithiol system redox-active protein YtxJ [Cytophagaceae bacterium]|jgi:bacillithiol system protein YtxJ|nr:bacillithiol system redox-active protein YtxJ [Cytophagaceae bacterium]